MPELPFAASDAPLWTHQYLHVETHAWWLTTLGPHQYLAEHRIRQWVPAEPERPWLLDRDVTGRRRWLTGSDVDALADGYDLGAVVPVGRFRAVHGTFDDTGGDADSRERVQGGAPHACGLPVRPRGTWQAPTREFFALLPHDVDALLHRIRADNPGRWFGPFAAGVTALRTCLVPAPLRSALGGALLQLPGVTVVDGVENLDGQQCRAIVHDAGRTRTELLFSLQDGQFAGERDTLRVDSPCGLRAGTMISSTATRTAVVDAEGVLP